MADNTQTTERENPAEDTTEQVVANEEVVAVEETPSEEVAEASSEEEAIEPSSDSKTSIPDFRAGDTLRLGVRIKEGEKVRIQYFEGIVLSRKGMGVNKTFTIRKIGAGGIAVERIFPLYSPALASFEVRRRGVTRRAKVYFLRDIVGSTANVIKERKVVRDHTATKAAKAEKKAARLARKAEATPKAATKKTGTRSANRAKKAE